MSSKGSHVSVEARRETAFTEAVTNIEDLTEDTPEFPRAQGRGLGD